MGAKLEKNHLYVLELIVNLFNYFISYWGMPLGSFSYAVIQTFLITPAYQTFLDQLWSSQTIKLFINISVGRWLRQIENVELLTIYVRKTEILL